MKVSKTVSKTTTKTVITAELDLSKASLGSLYARSTRKGAGFTLYKKYFLNGKPVHEPILEGSYSNYSLNIYMSFAEANKRVSELNKSNKTKKKEIAQRDRNFKRYYESITSDHELFPADGVKIFLNRMERENFGSQKHLEKKQMIFGTAQEIIKSLKIKPDFYFDNSKLIYKKLIQAQYSVNYCQKLISVMNDRGKFFCLRGSGFYKAIPAPRGIVRSQIDAAAKQKTTGVRKEALPMTVEILDRIISTNKTKIIFTEKEINFFKATFYFGLRPDELVKAVNGGNNYSRFTDIKSGLETIRIEQEKLKNLSQDKRMKLIAVKCNEQVEAYKIIELKMFSKPTYAAIKKMAKELKCNTQLNSLGLYSGRKGFINWCFDRGETDCFAISSWMGHSSPEMSFRVYRDRQRLLSGNMNNVGLAKIS